MSSSKTLQCKFTWECTYCKRNRIKTLFLVYEDYENHLRTKHGYWLIHTEEKNGNKATKL